MSINEGDYLFSQEINELKPINILFQNFDGKNNQRSDSFPFFNQEDIFDSYTSKNKNSEEEGKDKDKLYK